MNNRLLTLFIALPLFLGIASCGFHLRGSLDNLSSSGLQGQKVYINVIKDEQHIESDIRRVLLLSDVDIVNKPEESSFQIFILSSNLSRYASGLDTNGRTNEYEFIMQVDFLMTESNEVLKEIKEPHRISTSKDVVEKEKSLKVSRHYYFDTNDLIGKKTEEKTLLNEMKNNLSFQLLQQFTAFNNSSNKKSGLSQ
jgi:outer membrane lipopolysaccharide assembly protein LptE/RlpB